MKSRIIRKSPPVVHINLNHRKNSASDYINKIYTTLIEKSNTNQKEVYH